MGRVRARRRPLAAPDVDEQDNKQRRPLGRRKKVKKLSERETKATERSDEKGPPDQKERENNFPSGRKSRWRRKLVCLATARASRFMMASVHAKATNNSHLHLVMKCIGWSLMETAAPLARHPADCLLPHYVLFRKFPYQRRFSFPPAVAATRSFAFVQSSCRKPITTKKNASIGQSFAYAYVPPLPQIENHLSIKFKVE